MKKSKLWTLALGGLFACGSAMALQPVGGIQEIAGYEGIRVYEATYITAHQTDFAAGDQRLISVLSGAALSQQGRDFGNFNGNENYDLYFSNADGSFNANGRYLTIDGNCDLPSGCFNITEAAVRVNGTDQLATGVVRAVYGQTPFVANSEAFAADGDFTTFTRLGDTTNNFPTGRMSITLSFANVPAVPEPESYAMMLAGLGLLGFMARRRKQKKAAAA